MDGESVGATLARIWAALLGGTALVLGGGLMLGGVFGLVAAACALAVVGGFWYFLVNGVTR